MKTRESRWLATCAAIIFLIACRPTSPEIDEPSEATLILAGVTMRDPGATS